MSKSGGEGVAGLSLYALAGMDYPKPKKRSLLNQELPDPPGELPYRGLKRNPINPPLGKPKIMKVR